MTSNCIHFTPVSYTHLDVYKRQTDTDLKALDPMKNWNSSCYYIYWTVYDRLIGFNEETGEFEPELAESWDISDDGMVYTFHLRKDVKWHDGSDFTAEDVKYTVERGIETGCGIYPSVSHATIIDPYTIEFHMLCLLYTSSCRNALCCCYSALRS